VFKTAAALSLNDAFAPVLAQQVSIPLRCIRAAFVMTLPLCFVRRRSLVDLAAGVAFQ
jgi:hypothetical protein